MSGRWIVPAALALAALIHLLPLQGLLGATQLKSIYGLAVIDATTEMLLRHRALMFGLNGLLLLAAIPSPPLRLPAIAFTLASDMGFLALATAALTPQVLRIEVADTLSILALTVALVVLLASWRLQWPATPTQ